MNLWQPFNPNFISNPYPFYDKIRSEAPVYKTQTKEYLITDYQIASQVLKNKEDFKVGNSKEWLTKGVDYFQTKDKDFSAILEAINSFILLINPPQHRELRKFVSQAWNDRDIDQIIKENCEYLIKNINSFTFDFIENFASHLPSMTICKIMGIDYTTHEKLRIHGEQMVKALDFYLKVEDLVKIDNSSKAFIQTFRNIISSPPKTGLISRIIALNNQQHKPLNDNQIISICIFLFVAGEETTVSFLSTSVYHLIKNDRWKDLVEHDIDKVVNELLRYDGPVQLLGRLTNKDVILNDLRIPKGSSIIISVAAANRDPSIFNNPNEINFNRSERHLAFGSGNHFCLGDWLAKKQVSIALKALFSFMPKPKIANDIQWKRQLAIRRLKHLQIKI